MKTVLVAWLAFSGLQPDSVSAYEFESQEICEQNVTVIEQDNSNVKAVCISLALWKKIK
jgi:hypothetical protein